MHSVETNRVLHRMNQHMNMVLAAWNPIDPKMAGGCAASLSNVLTAVLTMGGELWADGSMGVAGKTSYGMFFGVVPTYVHRGHEFEVTGSAHPHGLYCWHPTDRSIHPLVQDSPTWPCAGGEVVVLPVPITWSTHS